VELRCEMFLEGRWLCECWDMDVRTVQYITSERGGISSIAGMLEWGWCCVVLCCVGEEVGMGKEDGGGERRGEKGEGNVKRSECI